jgi:hypothetical protein
LTKKTLTIHHIGRAPFAHAALARGHVEELEPIGPMVFDLRVLAVAHLVDGPRHMLVVPAEKARDIARSGEERGFWCGYPTRRSVGRPHEV